LWNGVADPYLYRVAVEMRSASGHLLDRVEQRFGIRQIRIEPQQGLFLNGRHLQLRGVALHQDREGRGWAQSEADQRDDMAMIVEMGANSIRFTHYQHSDYLNDLADEIGLIDWAEIPLVTRWTLGQSLEPTPELVENARQQLTELIRQSVNHASIGVWSIANEIDFGRKLPRVYDTGELPELDPLPLLATLRAVARAEDPSRPTAIANCCYGRAGSPSVVDAADLSGLNRYFGWYYGVPGDLASALAKTHADYPSIPLAVSEYGAGGAVTQATDNPLGGPIDPFGKTQPEEYQAYVHESTWPLLAGRPDVWGTWLTFMFDFASPLRREGDSVDLNTKGMVTFDRKTRKDAYFFYKANWNPAPMVYIASRRHLVRALPVTDIKVYSNAHSTELWINGRSLGAMPDCPNRICLWRAVALSSGANVVRAAGSFESGTREDSATWTLAVGERVYHIDCGAIEGSLGPGGLYGSDDFFIGGTAAIVNPPVDEATKSLPKHENISGTPFESLMNSYRTGRFSYRLPLADGSYRVRLWFVEPDANPGQRRFSVLANGGSALSDLDVAASAGGTRKTLERSFTATAELGTLQLDFVPVAGEAIVSAIDVEPLLQPAARAATAEGAFVHQ
jgi:beta-galactosidase